MRPVLSLLWLTACGGAVLEAPVVALDPSAPTTVDDITANITGQSEGATGYRYSWTDGAQGSHDTATLPAALTARGDTWTVTVTPTDGEVEGESASASTVILNTPPTLASAAISSDTIQATGALSCVPTGPYDADGDAVTFSYAWTVRSAAAGDDAPTLTRNHFVPSDVVLCVVTPLDGEAAGAPVASPPFTVPNGPPSIAGVVITPADATTVDTLTCTPTGWTDPDGDPEGYSYAWTADGSPVGTDSATLLGRTKGESIVCTATPTDGLLSGDAVASAPLVIQNAEPSVNGVLITPNPAYANNALNCLGIDFNDPDGDDADNAYVWTVLHAGGGSDVIPGTDTPVLSPAHFDTGDSVTCELTPDDGDGVAAGTPEVGFRAISNQPPSLSSATIVESPAYTNTDLHCTADGWSDPDGHAPGYQYAWSRQVGGSGAFVAVGDSSDTLPSSNFAQTDVIVCTVTPDDGFGTGTAVASSGRTISNRQPSVASVTIPENPAYTNSDLSCATDGWADADGDAPGYQYAWTRQVGGSGPHNPVGSNSSTLAASNFAQADVITCSATPHDGFDPGTPKQSTPRTISNRAPQVDSVTIPQNPAYTTDDLSCVANGWSDDDGDAAGYSYAWTRQIGGEGGFTSVGGDSDTLAASAFSQTDVVRCTVTPDDGFDTGPAVASDDRTITNRVPSISSVSIPEDPAYTNGDLSCTPSGWHDDDGDTAGYRYAWTRQTGGTGSFVSVGGTDATLAASHFAQTDLVVCTVTPDDGFDTGSPLASAARVISNRAPSVDSVSIAQNPAYTNVDLTCTPTGWFDADGDSAGYTYAWSRQTGGSGSFVAVGGNSATLAHANYAQTDVVRCTVTPHDGFDAGPLVASPNRTISNRAPTAPVVSVTSRPEEGADDLVCTISSLATDADGDTLTYTFAWTLDGSPYAGATTTTTRTGDTISKATLAGCDEWTCRATASDGFTTANSSSAYTFALSPTNTTIGRVTEMGMPDQVATFAGTRGYWFQAPDDFTITGLRVPSEASSEAQNVDIVRFDNQPTITATNDFERLGCYRGVTKDGVIQTDIEVLRGDFIGIIGTRGNSTDTTSYGGSYSNSINGAPVTLTRLYTDTHPLQSGPVGGLISQTSLFGRTEMWYTTHGCPALPNSAVDGPTARYGYCWYASKAGGTCDTVCAAIGGTNLAPQAASEWPDTCAGPTSADISAMFYGRGNFTGFTGAGALNSGHSLGWGYANGLYYGKCTTGTAPVGAYPGEANNYGTIMPMCACFQRSIFGPEHTFNGITTDHFVTQHGCSPSGNSSNLAGDAQALCQGFYGPECVARPGYVASSATGDKLHMGTERCSGTPNSVPVQGTWCRNSSQSEGQCATWSTTFTTTGISNLVCECP